ncbi:MAG TPA: serine/threonine-protein kinase [Thermoanaerobaculia bacterium]|nr:serine/threonine-protein kinase [Thermoanaerobaculia bacterium]
MDADRFALVDALFEEALEVPPEERAGFLERACQGDQELRDAVAALLAADARAHTFLERSAEWLLEAGGPGEAAEAGVRFGPYRIVRLLGRGGMGAVYLAERDDGQFERRVALKLLHPERLDAAARQRFLAERQVLARLEHPGIARLYDGGETEAGVPFLVMEHVEGLPLDEYCDRNRLAIDERLRLFRKLLEAVAYAHQNLLVHRDIKPANVLVNAEGDPKLLDFGIAKLLTDEAGAGQTRTQLRPMTPGWASPEQVRGEAITTASDVYALGVVLYELLCGRSPYRLAGDLPHELERAILEQEPDKPSATLSGPRPGEDGPTFEQRATARRARPRELARKLRGDLDTIVATALRKDPQRRYRSVAELAADLDAWSRGLPISAQPDRFLYRASKFVGRHRVAVGLAGLAMVTIAGLFVGLLGERDHAQRERDKALRSLDFLVQLFRDSNPYTRQGTGEITARELLAQGARRVTAELGQEPEVQAALLDAVGQATLGLGGMDEAEPLLEQALDLRRRTSPDSTELANSLEALGWLRFLKSDHEAAERYLRETVALRRRHLGPNSTQLAWALKLLGNVLSERYRSTGAERAREIEAILTEALTIYRRHEVPLDVDGAAVLFHLARLAKDQGDLEKAEPLFREVLTINIARRGLDHPETALVRRGLGLLLVERGKSDEACEQFRLALEAQRKSLPENHPDRLLTLNDLGLALSRSGDFAGAEPLLREATTGALLVHGEGHAFTAIMMGNLANALEAQGELEEASDFHQRSLATKRAVYGERHTLVARNLGDLGRLRSAQGRHQEALDLTESSLALSQELLAAGHPEMAPAHRNRGLVLLGVGRAAEAEPHLRRSLELYRQHQAPGAVITARAEVLLGDCLGRLGRGVEAEELLTQGRQGLAAKLPADHPLVLDADRRIAALRNGAR